MSKKKAPQPVPPKADKPAGVSTHPPRKADKPAGVNARKKIDPTTELTGDNKTPTKPEQKQKPAVKPKYPKAVADMQGKWGERARTLVDVLKDNNIELKSNPLARFALTLCLFMGKYSHYIDYLPGNYRQSLDKGEFSKEQLTAIQKARLRAQLLKKEFPNFHDFMGLHKAENAKRKKERKPELNSTEASTLYVSYLLFGPQPKDPQQPAVKYITDHKILAARLAHEHTDQKRVFGDSTLKAMKKMDPIPKGTVIFFVPGIKKGMTVAYATGQGKEFVYFTPGMKDKKSFKLDAPTSPIKTDLNLMAAFVPTNLQAAVKPEPAGTKPATAATPGTPATAPSKAPTLTPAALEKSVTDTVADVEKELKVAMKQKNPALKYSKAAKILSLSIPKIEDAAKKATPQFFKLHPKLKAKYELALKRYHTLIVAILRTKKKESDDNDKALKRLRPKLIAELSKTKRDKMVIAKIRKELILPELYDDLLTMIKPNIADITKYLKRAKECLPKSSSK